MRIPTAISSRLLTSRSNVKDGGWVEFCDWKLDMQSPDGSVGPDTPLMSFNHQVCRLANEMGQNPNPGPQLEGWLRDAGFVDINVKRCPMPMGTWAKDKHLVRRQLVIAQ